MKVVAIIPAGGKGIRTGKVIPKQFIKFYKKELIAYTIEIFQHCSLIDEIIIAVEKKYISKIFEMKKKYQFQKITNVFEGGRQRQDSVYNALLPLNLNKNDLVVVHDAVRPLLPVSILNDAIKTAIKKRNAVVAIKAKDTLIKGKTVIENYIARENVFQVQTPQIFRYSDLMIAMKNAYKNNFIGTDESMLVHQIGIKVNIVDGSIINFKITSKEDIDIFKNIIKNRIK